MVRCHQRGTTPPARQTQTMAMETGEEQHRLKSRKMKYSRRESR